jgi:hypothetical protein
MPTPKLNATQVAEVSRLVADYISAQRRRYAPRSAQLSPRQKTNLAAFFSAELLEDVRLLVLESERIRNPDFYPTLRNLGFTNLPDQTGMAAITFSDVVVSHERFSDGLLFHELVHVEQYRQLGIPTFAHLYVQGFLKSGSYEAIPLEVNAYTLEARFVRNPQTPFDVSREVAKLAGAGKL